MQISVHQNVEKVIIMKKIKLKLSLEKEEFEVLKEVVKEQYLIKKIMVYKREIGYECYPIEKHIKHRNILLNLLNKINE